MGRYFGREPRYSREELERQAQEAIDARVSMGRPPEEDFVPIENRLDELAEAVLARPFVEPERARPPAVPAVQAADAAPTAPATRGARMPMTAERSAN